MPHLRVALLGCGNVGRALLAMVAEKAEALREEQNLTLTLYRRPHALGGRLDRAGWHGRGGAAGERLAAETRSGRRAAVYRRWRGVRARVSRGRAGRADRRSIR